jgi:hypothetical protein
MPLTTYTAGEVLTASSLNANFSFAASNPPGGLELVSTTTIGTTVASVTVTGAFSSSYDFYFITISGGVASTANYGNLTLGATVTEYYQKSVFGAYTNNTIAGAGYSNNSSWEAIMRGSTNSLQMAVTLNGPNLAKNTYLTYLYGGSVALNQVESGQGILNDTTQYTAFTLTANTGTWTGGTIRVYGYANS